MSAYLETGSSPRRLRRLLIDSVPGFAIALRGLVRLRGGAAAPRPVDPEELIDEVERTFGLALPSLRRVDSRAPPARAPLPRRAGAALRRLPRRSDPARTAGGCAVRRFGAALGLCLLALAAAASAQELAPIPPLTGPVVDRAGLLSPSQRAVLDTLARELQAKTGAQMAVLTVESTAPEEIFGYGMRVAEAWQLGSREKDEGLLLVLASRDRKLRFFTGYGLEGVLPDGKLGRILDREAIPRLQRGAPGEAIVAAMQAAAGEIAADAGVTLTGVAPRAPPPVAPAWRNLLLIALLSSSCC